MHVDQPGELAPAAVAGEPTPPLPTSIWVVAWSSLLGQVVVLVPSGVREADASMAGSVLLSALVVGWVSAGVVRARTVRLVIAWVVLVLIFLADLVGLVTAAGAERWWLALSLATTVATLLALIAFRRSDWFAWQRTRPASHHGASVVPLVVVAVLTGGLGGLTDPGGRLEAEVRVSARG